MNPALKQIPENMKEFGIGALRHALRLSLYSDYDNRWWSELSVLNAAHAAEMLIKARIAAEHPLLIFSQVPRSGSATAPLLDFEDLFERGQTLDFQDLPERLWATTGVKLPNLEDYRAFGRYRNAIQHFAPPGDDASGRTLEFVFRVVDPFIRATWGLYAIDFNEEMGEHYEHIFETLVERNIRPLISPDAARYWSQLAYEPGDDAPPGYKKWFKATMAAALKKSGK